ncbi:MAG: hypothetical protein AAGA74_19735 [Pseudomonadota bacterium]
MIATTATVLDGSRETDLTTLLNAHGNGTAPSWYTMAMPAYADKTNLQTNHQIADITAFYPLSHDVRLDRVSNIGLIQLIGSCSMGHTAGCEHGKPIKRLSTRGAVLLRESVQTNTLIRPFSHFSLAGLLLCNA